MRDFFFFSLYNLALEKTKKFGNVNKKEIINGKIKCFEQQLKSNISFNLLEIQK